jgi:excisionase family DNA binding protein
MPESSEASRIVEVVLNLFAGKVGIIVRQTIQEEMAKLQVMLPPKPPAVPEGKGLINTRQVAKLLQLSERTVWAMANKNAMPKPIKLGTRVRWAEEEIHAWVMAGCPANSDWQKVKNSAPNQPQATRQ